MARYPQIISEDHSKKLFKQALAGDMKALNSLFCLLRPEIRNTAQPLIPQEILPKVDCSDVVQSTLQDAFKSFPEFRGLTIAEFWAWLCTINQNNAKSMVARFKTQRRDTRKEVPFSSAMELVGRHSAEEEIRTRELEQLRLKSFGELSEQDRNILNLRIVKGLSYEQISELLGENEVVLRKRYSRAMTRWTRKIDGHSNSEDDDR